MNYAIILGGGSGTRLKSSKIPKQFIKIQGKEIFLRTLQKFFDNKNIDKIILACNKEWLEHAKDLVSASFDGNKIDVIPGGSSRAGSIKKSFEYICENFDVKNTDNILTHDSVRPFVTTRIIDEHINQIKDNHVIHTSVKTIDVMYISKNGLKIDEVPNRHLYWTGQTPQSCNIKTMKKIFDYQYDEEDFTTTDLCKLAYIVGLPIYNVHGEYYNLKITTDADLDLAEFYALNGK